MNRLKLTNETLLERCLPPPAETVTANGKPVKQKLYFDTEVRGFGVIVTRNDRSGVPTRTFFVQREVNGRSRRVTIGRLGDLKLVQARRRAQEIIPDMLKGVDPNAEKRRARARGVTLQQAANDYRSKPAKRSREVKATLTLKNHDRFLDALKDWQKRPLAELSRAEVLARHKRLTSSLGPVGANNVMRWFRSVYNAAMIVYETLPPNPCIVLGDRWNKEKRKRSPIPWDRLADWSEWLETELRARNPVRADLMLFILFTGLRSTDAATVRWDDVNFEQRILHRPKPKGGVDRAFDIPYGNAVATIFERRRIENPKLYGHMCPWVFPTFGRYGGVTHVSELKEEAQPSPHRLRDTFATAAHEAGVALLDTKTLMNHQLPGGDVTEGYMRPAVEHLRLQQEKIVCHLQNHMHISHTA